MSPRYRIVAIAAATNAVFVVPVLVISIDLDRTCSLFPDGCDGYQYFGVALAFVFALGPGTAAALASALLARRSSRDATTLNSALGHWYGAPSRIASWWSARYGYSTAG